ncbi:hypothetical protein ScPMuIL_004149 [Solemya velum]
MASNTNKPKVSNQKLFDDLPRPEMPKPRLRGSRDYENDGFIAHQVNHVYNPLPEHQTAPQQLIAPTTPPKIQRLEK